MRHGPTLPPLSCSVSDSSRSDSPRSAATSISPDASPQSPNYSRIPADPPIRRHEPTHATPEEVEFTMKAVMRYAEIDSRRNTREDSPPTQRRYNDRESNEMDTDSRDGSLPLDDIIHHYDSPVHSPMHKPGSLQDILTEDCSPNFHHSADMLKEGSSVSSSSTPA
ncbi:hypothetical protein EST38_g7339 [Candolleomyces aberdarensis]|uniref:Uncharacterized protein n=1 Tax=Candolleomyces aberdarensis TaxID=2316362 RepID=A0A4Q2DHC4_9AGAR|nr:hypothetical protein EST38_g7339 [Candolleomyces aberdarensis]